MRVEGCSTVWVSMGEGKEKSSWRRCARGAHPYPSRTRRLRRGRPRILRWRRRGKAGGCQLYNGGVAQLGEHLPCKQGVKSSNLSVSIAKEGERGKARTLKTSYREDRRENQSNIRKPRKRNEKEPGKPQRYAAEREGPAKSGEGRSSGKERGADALAPGAEERRDKLRKAAGRGTYPEIRGCLNGETRAGSPCASTRESITRGGEPGELKHLSSRRKRKKHRFRE